MRKLFFLLIIQFIILQTAVYGQFFFTVELMEDNVTYMVKVRPDESFPAPTNFTSSMQVGFTVPTGGFKPSSDVNSINGNWTISSTHTAPSENPGFDYIAFELSGGKDNIAYIANEETELFSFENIGECTGTLDFITEDDLFFPPNSENANIGNLITVFGAGFGNAFSGTYGPAANCLMEQAGNSTCEQVDSIVTTNPSECGLVGGTIRIYADPTGGPPLKYSIDDGVNFQDDPLFTGLASAKAYVIIVADEGGLCFKDHGVIELGPATDAVIIRTSTTPDNCMMSDGTITIEAAARLAGTTLEYSIDQGATWLENDGLFTGLAAGTYQPWVRGKDLPCHDETEEIVVAAACPDGGGGTDPDPGPGNTNCLYTMVLDAADGKFTISVIPTMTISVPQNTTPTALFSIKVPTGTFDVTNFESLIGGANFEVSGRTNAPVEAPEFDYISFGLTSLGTRTIEYKAGEKLALFSFENGGSCTGEQVFLVENFTDPFYGNASEWVGQQLTVAQTGTDLSIICSDSNIISDCGEDLDDTDPTTPTTNFPTDTIYLSLPVEETTNVCIEDELDIANGSIGTVSLCNAEETVVTTLTAGSNCFDITTDDHFNQSETICIVHFDANDATLSDTTILILCPEVSLGADLAVCAGETVTLSPLGGTGNFNWITDGDISCTDCANPEITPTAATQYILMSTEAGRCMDSDTLMVNVLDVPNIAEVMATQPTNCMSNGQILITADGGIGDLQYSIDNGVTFQDNPQFDGLGAGDFVVLVANADETCSSSWPQSVNLIIEGAPSIVDVNVTAPNVCRNEQGAIVITATSANSADVLEYSIDGGATWQDNGTFGDLQDGSYDLMVRIQGSSCDAVFANNPVEISQQADLRITTPPVDQMICSESDRTVQLELNETITDFTINSGPFENENATDNILTFEANPVPEGSLYSITITGESGCTITEEFTLTPGEDTDLWNPVIETTPASCDEEDGTVSVVVNGNNNGFTFCWEPNKASGPMREGLSADSTYSLTITGASGCTLVYENINVGTTCEQASCNIFTGLDTLNAFVSGLQATACIPIANMDLSEYQFYIGDELQNVGIGECMQTSVFYPYKVLFDMGTAPFTLTKWSVNSDTLKDFQFNTIEELVIKMNQFDFQANWIVNQELEVIQGFSTANVYGSLNAQATGSSQIAQLELNTMNTMFQSIILPDTRGITKYTLKDPLNDCEDDLYIKVQGLEDGMDTLDLFTVVNTPILDQCLNTTETGTENLTIRVCNDPSAGILSGIDGETDECFGYMPNTDFIGKDFFCLELCNGAVCDTTLVSVTVNEEGLLFYTGFSPNNDGINDVFTIKNIESYPLNSVLIYNRWGNKIYGKENYTNNEGWDGTFDKRLSPDGIYFYVVKIVINNEEKVFSGPITVTR